MVAGSGRDGAGGPDGFERITPIPVTPGAGGPLSGGAAPAGTPRAGGARWAWTIAGVAGLLALGLGAGLLWHWRTPPGEAGAGPVATERAAAEPPPDAQPAASASGGSRDSESESTEPSLAREEVDRVLVQHQQAEELAARLDQARARLQARGVSGWGGEAWQRLTARAEQGRTQLAGRDFDAALTSFREALDLVAGLEELGQQTLAQALAEGHEALDSDQAEAAVAAFDRALAIEPDHAGARTGRNRAENLPRLKALLDRAAAAEAAGDRVAARDAYAEAGRLDPQSKPAAEGLARVRAALAGAAFNEQMSRGLAALQGENLAAAERAFEAALRSRPGSIEARDGLARARDGLQRQTIAAHRERAEAAERDERWAEARDAYAAALAVDASLVFAREGRERATRRAALDVRLQAHIDDPARLRSAEARADAGAALADARTVATPPGPRLGAQIERLDRLLSDASTPVPVTLRSDGLTEVIVYHVGELGRFQSRELALLPGRYTAVGRRPGYRDVRIDFVVTAQGGERSPLIRCEERI